jgi:hypothetical protein
VSLPGAEPWSGDNMRLSRTDYVFPHANVIVHDVDEVVVLPRRDTALPKSLWLQARQIGAVAVDASIIDIRDIPRLGKTLTLIACSIAMNP